MRADALNWHGYGGSTEITAPSLDVYSSDKDRSKRIIVNETLSQIYSANEDKSKRIIVHEGLLENLSTDISKSKGSIVNKTLS